MRVEPLRAFWKLVIYWNICAICQDFRDDDYDFHQYSTKIQCINPMIGPIIKSSTSSQHEIEEMRCVLSTTQKLLGCTTRSFEIFTLFSEQNYPKPCIKTSASLTNLNETVHWKFQEPRPMEVAYKEVFYGQGRRQLPEGYMTLIDDWDTACLSHGSIIEGMRLYQLRPIVWIKHSKFRPEQYPFVDYSESQ